LTHILLISPDVFIESRLSELFDHDEIRILTERSVPTHSNHFPIPPDIILLDRSVLKNQVSGYINLLGTFFIETPILLLIPKNAEEDIATAFRAGIFDIVDPDVTDVYLLTQVQRAINKRREWQGVRQHIEQLKLFNVNLQKKIDDLRNEVKDTESFTESIMMALGAGLITFDMSGKINYANPSAANIFGWSVINLLGMEVNSIMPIEANIGQILDGSEFEKQYECDAIRSDGKKLKIGYTLFPRKNDHNDVVEMICIFRDLFELEKVREENRRLEKISTLGQIAAGIAHEVKNPLAGIQSIVSAIILDFQDDDIRKSQIEQIGKEVARINQLLENSFAFARTKKPQFTQSDLNEVVKSVINLLSIDFQKKGIICRYEVGSDVPKFRFDPTQIHQVVLNLVMNAVDSMTSGGTLFINLVHKVAPRHVKGFVILEITDTGSGIHPDNLRRIFDPFYTTKPLGTGLGLPITYKIIQDHMGKIDVESEIGRGTKFTLYLPD